MKDGKKTGKAGIIGVAGVIVILMLLLGKGFGFGGGGGGNAAPGSPAVQNADTDNASAEKEKTEKKNSEEASGGDSEKETKQEELPDRITVTVNEDRVFIGDKEIKNEEELKAYLEEINTDSREYYLEDENSILETYEWVNKVFEEMEIRLITE